MHVHLPLHLLCALGSMTPAHLRARVVPLYPRSTADRQCRYSRESRECLAWGRMDRRCSSRYGRGFPDRPLRGRRLGLLRSARPLRSGRRSTAVHQVHPGPVGAERPLRRRRPRGVRTRHQRPAPRAAERPAPGVPGPAGAAPSDALELAAGLRGARSQPGEPGGGRGGGFGRIGPWAVPGGVRQRQLGVAPSPAPAGEFPPVPLYGKVVWALFRLSDCAKNGM